MLWNLPLSHQGGPFGCRCLMCFNLPWNYSVIADIRDHQGSVLSVRTVITFHLSLPAAQLPKVSEAEMLVSEHVGAVSQLFVNAGKRWNCLLCGGVWNPSGCDVGNISSTFSSNVYMFTTSEQCNLETKRKAQRRGKEENVFMEEENWQRQRWGEIGETMTLLNFLPGRKKAAELCIILSNYALQRKTIVYHRGLPRIWGEAQG